MLTIRKSDISKQYMIGISVNKNSVGVELYNAIKKDLLELFTFKNTEFE